MSEIEPSQREDGQLSAAMVVRLQSWRRRALDKQELEVLRSCLHSDPRAEILILRLLEFEDDFDLHGLGCFAWLLIEEGKVSPAMRFWLRDLCSHSCGEDGFSYLPALNLMRAFGDDAEHWHRWFFLRISQRDEQLKAARDIYAHGGLRDDVFDWLPGAALDEPALVPLLMTDRWAWRGTNKAFLVALACQTTVNWDDYDLGDLAEPLADACKRVEGIEGTRERAKLLGYHVDGRPVTAGDAASLRRSVEGDGHPPDESYLREVATRVEHAIDKTLLDPEGRFAFALEMPVKTASPRTRELWMRVLEVSSNDSDRNDALQLLASYHGDHPETRLMLLKFASRGAIRQPVGPERNLAMAAFDWLRVIDSAEAATVDSLHRYSDSYFYGFADVQDLYDGQDFQPGSRGSDHRRQRWMEGVLNQKSTAAERCAFSLAYWFGEHPETLPFLEELVRASAEPPEHYGTILANSEDVSRWQREPERRAYWLRIIGLRWPENPRVRQLAREMLEHPWLEVRREAVEFLTREFGADLETFELLERHMGRDANIFSEYLTLRMGAPAAIAKALAVLETLDDSPEAGDLANDGPVLLARIFGPRKDLRKGLEDLYLRSSREGLRQSISRVLERFWRKGLATGVSSPTLRP